MPEPRPRRDLSAALDALDRDGLRRTLRVGQGLDLTGNDVLGLATDPTVRAALQAALAAGTPHGSTGSRLLSGHHAAWEAWEARVAAWQGAQAALTFSSGWAANAGFLPALLQRGDVVVSDALNHASLIDGLRLSGAERVIVPHGDADAARAALRARPGRPAWIVTESVFSMDGDRAPLRDWAALADAEGARLIVDEAHATGLFGPSGQGLVAAEGLRDGVFLTLHTLGKALGLAGAMVVAERSTIDWLVQRARSFVFSTAPPPFLAAGLHAALDRVEGDAALRARPLHAATRLRQALARRGLPPSASTTHVEPVVAGSAAAALALADGLQRRGWDVRAVRPPTVPEGTSRVRLVASVRLTDAAIDRLAADVAELRGR